MRMNVLKLGAAMLAALLILTASGCGGVAAPASNDAASSADVKILLKLERFEPGEPDESSAAEFTPRFCSIPAAGLTETVDAVYAGDTSLAEFAQYASDTFGVVPDSRWTYTVHYYDDSHTAGMVKFIYRIGDMIETNQAIVFYISDGVASQVTCTYLNDTADEHALIAKLDAFLAAHEQQKTNVLGDGFSICGDSTHYIYNYRTEKLTYSYTIFYVEDESGIIINDYGTEAVIN